MTDKEKARAYDKALERAKNLYAGVHKGCKEVIDNIFPELAESEDERIRKELKEAFEAYDIESSWNGIPIRSIFAWLEKQEEQKPAPTNEEKEYVRTLKSLIADFLRGKEEIDTSYYQKIYDWLDGRHIEQKPAEWSEEEIENINAICSYLDNYCWLNARDGYGVEECKVRKEWLKSLPNRFNLPAEQEWSEEDERKRLACIDTINEVIDYERDRWEDYNPGKPYRPITKYDEQIDWLKSLRPRWKPSEEQMEALRETIDFAPDTFKPKCTLESLYEQLKRL